MLFHFFFILLGLLLLLLFPSVFASGLAVSIPASSLHFSATTSSTKLMWGCSAETAGQVFPWTGHVELKLSDGLDCTTNNESFHSADGVQKPLAAMQGCRGPGRLRPLPALGSAADYVHLKTAPVLKKPGQQEWSCSSSAEELQMGDAGGKLKSSDRSRVQSV